MFANDVLDTVGTEVAGSCIREQWIRWTATVLSEPAAQHGDGGLAQRGAPVLATLAVASDVGASFEDEGLDAKSGELGAPEPGLDGDK